MTVGLRRTTSSRPGDVAVGEAGAHEVGVERAYAAEERLDRGERQGCVVRLVHAEHRQEHLVVLTR